MKNNLLYKIRYYLYWFITGTILGFTTEVIYSLVIRNKLVHPGTLSGPFCPIYGAGIVILVLILHDNKNKFISFLNCFLAASLLEYSSAYISEVFFNNKIWDYSNYLFNIHGRVCLLYSLMWGIGGFLLISYVEPNAHKIFDKYQSKKTDIFFFTLIGLLIVDIIFKIIF